MNNNTIMGSFYTPTVEEVRLGFEFQVDTKAKGWQPKKLARNEKLVDLTAMLCQDLLDPRTIKNYRARYIDDKDIVSLGWEFTEKGDDDELSYTIANEQKVGEKVVGRKDWMLCCVGGDKNIIVEITCHTYTGDSNTPDDVFTMNYEIRSKNDLALIMQFSGIEADTRTKF